MVIGQINFAGDQPANQNRTTVSMSLTPYKLNNGAEAWLKRVFLLIAKSENGLDSRVKKSN
jgi:hypothetical protein